MENPKHEAFVHYLQCSLEEDRHCPIGHDDYETFEIKAVADATRFVKLGDCPTESLYLQKAIQVTFDDDTSVIIAVV